LSSLFLILFSPFLSLNFHSFGLVWYSKDLYSHFRPPPSLSRSFSSSPFLSFNPFSLIPFFRFPHYIPLFLPCQVSLVVLVFFFFFLSSFYVFFSMLSSFFLSYHVSLVRLASLYFFLLYILGYFNYLCTYIGLTTHMEGLGDQCKVFLL
jgi:hypothetical protein